MDVPALINAMMAIVKAGGGKQAELAERLGVDQPQISRWKNGQKPTAENRDRIVAVAREFGLIDDLRSEDVAAELPNPPPPRSVKLKGYVGASGEAVYFRVADEDLEEVDAPVGANDQTVAVEIKGKSFGPLMNTWLVFYDDVRSPVTPDLIGQVCVVGLADDRILIKEIRRNGRGGYALLSNSSTDEPIDNAEIEWAAKVTSMRPR